MADPTLVITFGDDEFPLSHVTAQEVIRVKEWIGCRNRRDWYSLISDEDPAAIVAALVIARRRKGIDADFATADFDLDAIEAKFVDDRGAEVEPVLVMNEDGSPKLGSDGAVIPVLGSDGKPQWRDVVEGTVVPFGDSASRTTSATPLPPGSSSASGTGA